jgi:hypothetical protein
MSAGQLDSWSQCNVMWHSALVGKCWCLSDSRPAHEAHHHDCQLRDRACLAHTGGCAWSVQVCSAAGQTLHSVWVAVGAQQEGESFLPPPVLEHTAVTQCGDLWNVSTCTVLWNTNSRTAVSHTNMGMCVT